MAPAIIDREFGEHFLTAADDFYAYGVHLLFNDWWEKAPSTAIATYVQAIDEHPEQGPLAREGWFAPGIDGEMLAGCGPGTLGEAYRRFMSDNDLMERLAEGYRALHDSFATQGRLGRMPPLLRYKVLRGYQTHDLHHVLTGYPATPYGELALQAFSLAQTPFPYAGMWIAVVTTHIALLEPDMIVPAMDAITRGWQHGRRARSIQFVKFETLLHEPLEELRARFALDDPGRVEAITASTLRC